MWHRQQRAENISRFRNENPKKSFSLHKAVEYRNLHKIKILLPDAKDINEKNEKGYTVLLIACEFDPNQEILDLLLSRKDIDITQTNIDGFNALHILAFRGNLQGVIKIMDKFPKVNIEAETDKGNTALIMAAKMNHVDVIKYLSSKGANVKHRNEKMFTALHYAANNGCTESTELLISLGAELNAKDNYGLTPLMKSAKWGFLQTCEILLEKGADVNIDSNGIQTALRSVCFRDNAKLAKLLISYGADVNYPGPFSTALFECAKFGNLQCAKELIKAGVKVTGRAKNGKNAMEFAKLHGHLDFVELVRKHF